MYTMVLLFDKAFLQEFRAGRLFALEGEACVRTMIYNIR